MKSIESNDDLQEFLYKTDFFHDCLLKRVNIFNKGFVDHEGQMHYDTALFNSIFLFQSQFVSDVPPFLIYGIEIIKCNLTESTSCFNLFVGDVKNGVISIGDDVDYNRANFFLSCKKMRYRMLDSSALASEISLDNFEIDIWADVWSDWDL